MAADARARGQELLAERVEADPVVGAHFDVIAAVTERPVRAIAPLGSL